MTSKPFRNLLFFLLTILLLTEIYYKFSNYPIFHLVSLLSHVSIFVILSIFFTVSFTELGRSVRRLIIKSDFSTLDLGFGMGAFAWILQFYNKIYLEYHVPALFLFIFFLLAIYRFQVRFISLNFLRIYPSSYIDFLILGLALTQLLEFGVYDGLLEYTTDFDSSFHHIVLAQAMVSEGYYFSPLWLRAPFIPQLTHSLYIFILSIFKNDILFIKLINWLAFYQIFKIFLNRRRDLNLFLGGVFVLIIVYLPEFTYLYNTNLDALLGLYFLCSFVMLYHAFKTSFNIPNVLMIVIFCGFAGGQKHFGLMFSMPILLLTLAGSIIHYFKLEVSKKKSYQVLANSVRNKTFYLYILSFVSFFLIFIPFYIHNFLANSNLFFPFFGKKENGFGWSKQDIDDFTGPTINHWGHQKTFTGFFELPYDLIYFPEDFQFFQTNSWQDYLVPFLFLFPIFFLFISLRNKNLRKFLFLSICLIVCYAFWFKSSQVIRYLFPISLGSLFLLYIYLSNLKCLNTKFTKISFILLFFCSYIYLSIANFKEINFIIPSNSTERLIHRGFLYGQIIEGNLKISQANKRAGVLEFGPLSVMMRSIFPNLKFCGDWFGGCSFAKFTYQNVPMKFRSWAEIKEGSTFLKIDYISIYWTQFSGGVRPTKGFELNEVFPDSVKACIKPFYSVLGLYDIYSVKQECK